MFCSLSVDVYSVGTGYHCTCNKCIANVFLNTLKNKFSYSNGTFSHYNADCYMNESLDIEVQIHKHPPKSTKSLSSYVHRHNWSSCGKPCGKGFTRGNFWEVPLAMICSSLFHCGVGFAPHKTDHRAQTPFPSDSVDMGDKWKDRTNHTKTIPPNRVHSSHLSWCSSTCSNNLS